MKDLIGAFDIKYDEIKLPRRATAHSAGYDIYSVTDFTLNSGECILLPTGIKVKLDSDKWLQIVPRSGSGFKFGIALANTCGVIDSDYYNNSKNEGHIWVKLTYPRSQINDKPFVVKKGDAICQGIISQYFVTEDDGSSEKRVGGFGSTSGEG